MRKLLLFIALFTMAFGGAAFGLTLDEALAFFANEQVMIDFSDAGKAQLEEIIDALKVGLGAPADLNEASEDAVGALDIPMEMKDVVNKLSQAYYTLANVFLTTDDYYPETEYLHGKNWGFKSLRMNPEFNDLTGGRFDDSVARETDVAAMYWTNANWLRAVQKDKMTAIFAGVPAKSEMLTNRVMEVDATFVSGGPYRSFGAYYEQLPGLFGRDINKALTYLCHVNDEPTFCSECEVGDVVPDAAAYFENRTFFVEYYLIPEKHWEAAARVLQSVLDEPIGELYPLMNAYAQDRALDLLEEVNEHL